MVDKNLGEAKGKGNVGENWSKKCDVVLGIDREREAGLAVDRDETPPGNVHSSKPNPSRKLREASPLV